MTPGHTPLRNALLLSAAVAVTAGLIEVGARLAYTVHGTGAAALFLRESSHPGLGFELIPHGMIGDEYINSRGFRGGEIAVPKPPGVYRIVVLGDSQTLGGHDLGDSIPAHLEAMLNADGRLARHRRFEVINAGVTCYNIKEVYYTLVYKVRDLQPDLVVYDFFGNDLANVVYKPVTTSGGRQYLMLYHDASVGYEESGLLPGWVDRFLNEHLVSYRYALYAVRNARSPAVAAGSPLQPEERRNLGYFDRIVAVVREIGAGFAVVLIPSSENAADCDPREFNEVRNRAMASHAAARGVIVIDPTRAMCGMPKEELVREPIHFRPVGHRILAQKIKDELTAYLLPGENPR